MEEEKLKNKVTADKLVELLDDPKNIGFYYRLAEQFDHQFLLGIAYSLRDYPNARNKGALFTWKFKSEINKKSVPDEDDQEFSTNSLTEMRTTLSKKFSAR